MEIQRDVLMVMEAIMLSQRERERGEDEEDGKARLFST
jgi:hypothetical protein